MLHDVWMALTTGGDGGGDGIPTSTSTFTLITAPATSATPSTATATFAAAFLLLVRGRFTLRSQGGAEGCAFIGHGLRMIVLNHFVLMQRRGGLRGMSHHIGVLLVTGVR